MAHTYAIYIYYDSELNPSMPIFKYRFSVKYVGFIFFRPHIRIKNKMLHQLICIGMGYSVIYAKANSIEQIRPRQRNQLK